MEKRLGPVPLLSILFCCFALVAGTSRADAGNDLAEGLLTAARKQDIPKIDEILSRGGEVDTASGLGRMAFDRALQRGHRDVVRAFLAAGTKPSSSTADRTAPLRAAVTSGNVGLVEDLLAAGADLNVPAGLTNIPPLIEAVRCGHVNMVKALLAAGASPDATDGSGMTALHWAAEGGSLQMLRLLVASGADIAATDKHHRTVFQKAPRWVYLAAVQAHVARKTEICLAKGLGMTDLHRAAVIGDVAQVKTLLGQNADPPAPDSRGMSPLHWAAARGNIEAIEALLAAGAPVHDRDKDGLTALHYAALNGNAAVMTALLKAGADVHASDPYGVTPLHCAPGNGNAPTLQVLLAAGADVNAVNRWAETPLHWAARHGRVESIRLLVDAGADPNTVDKNGLAPLHAASSTAETPGPVEELLVRGASVNQKAGHSGDWTPLHFACQARRPDVIRVLLNEGADVHARTKTQKTPLLVSFPGPDAAGTRHRNQASEAFGHIVEVLVAHGADVNARPGNKLPASPLANAVREHDASAMKALIAAGADLDRKDPNFTPLEIAAGSGDTDAIKMLLAAGANVKAARSDLLLRAASWTDLEGIQALVAAGADPNGTDTYDFTILHRVTRPRVMEMLVAAGADVNAHEKRRGETPLHTARTPEVVQALLALGADRAARDKNGRTPLMAAAVECRIAVANALLAAGADVNERDLEDRTPLMILCARGPRFYPQGSQFRNTVELLLHAGADASAKDKRGFSALELARRSGSQELAALLGAYARGGSFGSPESDAHREGLLNCKELATRAINVFGLDMYAKLDRGDKSLVFSPLSAFFPLGISYQGAKSHTRQEMAHVLRIDKTNVPLSATLGAFSRDVPATVREGGGELDLANGLWVNQSPAYEVAEDFRESTQKECNVDIRSADFLKAAAPVAQEINSWIGEVTHGKITGMVSPESLEGQVLAIVNAVYFKNKWAMPFKRDQTTQEDFYLLDGSRVKVPMMHHSSRKYRYMEDAGFQALEMPYQDWAVSMIVFLPKQGSRLADFEESLTPDKLAEWLDKLSQQPAGVNVSVPRFEIRSRWKLVPVLQTLGMKTAFERGSADFSGMLRSKYRDKPVHGVFISDILQEALIEVDEEGTTAAAATGMEFCMGGDPPKPKVFRADRPFLFLLWHKPSNCILFMGRVTRP